MATLRNTVDTKYIMYSIFVKHKCYKNKKGVNADANVKDSEVHFFLLVLKAYGRLDCGYISHCFRVATTDGPNFPL